MPHDFIHRIVYCMCVCLCKVDDDDRITQKNAIEWRLSLNVITIVLRTVIRPERRIQQAPGPKPSAVSIRQIPICHDRQVPQKRYGSIELVAKIL